MGVNICRNDRKKFNEKATFFVRIRGVSMLRYIQLRKKGFKKIGLLIFIGIIIWTLSSIYFAFYPTNRFYKKEFESNTKLDFPKTGKVISKGAEYPDLHGDYASAAKFEFVQKDYLGILNKIKTDSTFMIDTNTYSNSAYFRNKIEDFNMNSIENKFTKSDRVDKTFNIWFIKDKKTVIIERSSY